MDAPRVGRTKHLTHELAEEAEHVLVSDRRSAWEEALGINPDEDEDERERARDGFPEHGTRGRSGRGDARDDRDDASVADGSSVGFGEGVRG